MSNFPFGRLLPRGQQPPPPIYTEEFNDFGELDIEPVRLRNRLRHYFNHFPIYSFDSPPFVISDANIDYVVRSLNHPDQRYLNQTKIINPRNNSNNVFIFFQDESFIPVPKYLFYPDISLETLLREMGTADEVRTMINIWYESGENWDNFITNPENIQRIVSNLRNQASLRYMLEYYQGQIRDTEERLNPSRVVPEIHQLRGIPGLTKHIRGYLNNPNNLRKIRRHRATINRSRRRNEHGAGLNGGKRPRKSNKSKKSKKGRKTRKQ